MLCVCVMVFFWYIVNVLYVVFSVCYECVLCSFSIEKACSVWCVIMFFWFIMNVIFVIEFSKDAINVFCVMMFSWDVVNALCLLLCSCCSSHDARKDGTLFRLFFSRSRREYQDGKMERKKKARFVNGRKMWFVNGERIRFRVGRENQICEGRET